MRFRNRGYPLSEISNFFSMQDCAAYEGGMGDLRRVPCLDSRLDGEFGDIGVRSLP
jgi:hypothetical protein